MSKLDKSYNRVADEALRLMRRVAASRTGAIRAKAKAIGEIADSAADAVAAQLLGEDGGAPLRELERRLTEARQSVALVAGLEERWIALPAGGLGNDLNAGSDGACLADKGIDLYPGDDFTNSFPCPTPGADFNQAFGSDRRLAGPTGEAANALAATDLDAYVESRLGGNGKSRRRG